MCRASRSASLAATNSAAVPATTSLRKRGTARSNSCSSPHSQRASRKAVRTVMSFFASAISWRTERTEWPTLSFRSHSKCRVASAARSWSAVGAFAVRNIRSRSLKGAISPRPVPPRPTRATPPAGGSRSLADEIIGEADDLVVEEGRGVCGRPAIARLDGQAARDSARPAASASAKIGAASLAIFLPLLSRPGGPQRAPVDDRARLGDRLGPVRGHGRSLP